MPYLYSAAVLSSRTGEPMMRALLVDTPEDPAAWRADLEYLLGPDLLVAPMTDPEGARPVYLPAGEWVDFWTGEVHAGQRYIHVRKPLDQMPLFVRHGALVPEGQVRDTIGDGPFPDVTIRSWGGAGGETVVRDVDGDTVIRAVRHGDRFEVTVDGPARVSGVAFAEVDGVTAPTDVVIVRT
jgi:alpha-D-xyloside xylohydrolase